jgi:hypothetical protein
MKKTDWQYLVDTLLFICMVGIILIGLLLGLVIPEGPSTPESSKYFLNLHRHQWGNIHFYLSLTFIALLIVHLTLDWKWIKARANHLFKKGWKTALVGTVVVSLLLLFAIWLFHPKEPGAYEGYGIGRGKTDILQTTEDQDTITVTGQVTFGELEIATGIPARTMFEALGLPAKTSQKETIGRLRKIHGFSLLDVRDALTELLNVRTIPQNSAPSAQAQPDRTPARGRQPVTEVPETQAGQDKIEGEHEEKEKMTRGRLAEDQEGILITGQMSFYDIQRQTGISARQIMSKLGLPANLSRNENIGRLRRIYRFTLQDVRDIVESSIKKK